MYREAGAAKNSHAAMTLCLEFVAMQLALPTYRPAGERAAPRPCGAGYGSVPPRERSSPRSIISLVNLLVSGLIAYQVIFEHIKPVKHCKPSLLALWYFIALLDVGAAGHYTNPSPLTNKRVCCIENNTALASVHWPANSYAVLHVPYKKCPPAALDGP
jgi:hypothetical protein